MIGPAFRSTHQRKDKDLIYDLPSCGLSLFLANFIIKLLPCTGAAGVSRPFTQNYLKKQEKNQNQNWLECYDSFIGLFVALKWKI